MTQAKFGANPSTDATFCNQLVTVSCTAVDDHPASYYTTPQPLTPACDTECKQNYCAVCGVQITFCTSTCNSYASLPPVPSLSGGPSPITVNNYGVQSVTGPATCTTFSKFLKNYALGTSGFGTLYCPGAALDNFRSKCSAVLPNEAPWNTFPLDRVAYPTTATMKCCGTLGAVPVCPSLGAVVGILLGYLSAWFSVMGIVFRGVTILLNRCDSPVSPDASAPEQSTVPADASSTKPHPESRAIELVTTTGKVQPDSP
jgi:hypothetical protein